MLAVCDDLDVVISFDGFELDPGRYELRRGGERIAVEPQVLDVLLYLVAHADRVVTKHELLDEVWGSRFVSESALTSRIKSVRQALGDDGRTQRYVRTAHGRGYQFVGIRAGTGDATVGGTNATSGGSQLGNLPVDRTPLFGRVADIGAVTEAIARHRLVSLLGIGGTGKTRLATAVARDVAGEFPDGAWFVDLVPVDDGPGVVLALAETVALAVDGGRPALDQIVERLSSRRALVVFDNAEHVTADVAAVLDTLLERTTEPRFVVTSRLPLGLPDERRISVEPLATDPVDGVGGVEGVDGIGGVDGGGSPESSVSPAVQLLLATSERVGAPLDGVDPDLLHRICLRLDGLPLAIELAAAQLRHLDAVAVGERLDRRLDVLTDRARPGRERHASLQAVLADTWESLDEPEAALLEQLATFPSSFTLDDLIGVAAVDTASSVGDVSFALGGLVDRSLVVREAGRVSRYRLLETVKLFTRQQCEPSRAREVVDRHADWCLDVVGDDPRRFLYDFDLADWCTAHHADLRAAGVALRAAGRQTDVARLLAATALAMHIDTGPRASATLHSIESELDVVDDDGQIVMLHAAAVMCGMATRAPDVISEHGERGVEAARRTGDPVLVNAALVLRSWSTVFEDPDIALEMTGEAGDIAAAADEQLGRDFADGYRAFHLAIARRYDEAEALARAVVERAPIDERAMYPTYVGAMALATLSCVDHPDDAAPWVAEVLGAPTQHTSMWARDLVEAALYASRGDAVTAARIASTILARLDQAGQDPWPDLLIPAAAFALQAGDAGRAAGWLDTIRASRTPTQSFQATVVYRRLRDAVVGAKPVGPAGDTIDEIGRAAISWLVEQG